MTDYHSVRINMNPCTADMTDLAAAFLADAGFDSFEPDEKGLMAYIADSGQDIESFTREALTDFPFDTNMEIRSTLVEGKDWNEEWEKNYFKPIVIGGDCVIHSTFHKDVPEAKYDILIDPKMAFGTGHHDTTAGMVGYLLELPLEGMSLIDMGTGTGILAILASKRNVRKATGIEIDPAAYANAVENARLNDADIELILGDASALEQVEPADVFLANINRNIILGDIARYSTRLKSGGTMLLSGFYEEDVEMILEAANRYGLKEAGRKVSDAGWTALMLKKN
ncbi:MAG: 50S ribosomal protein L11 methyltransferase [Muribaculaceae bacterium]|nr:50S ribosomal protein L11 methyltransferase [Muribaculaceae bacterium]